MQRTVRLAALAAILLVAGCGGAGRYPITRAVTGPNDPVLQMSIPPSSLGG